MDASEIIETSPDKTKSPALSYDELTLHLIASGLVQLAKTLETGSLLTLPYPDPLQRGLNRLAANCLRQKVSAPHSISDLFTWCHRPLLDWPLKFPNEAIGSADTLLHANLPTEICEEWAIPGSDIEAHLNEQTFFSSVYLTCRNANDEATYVAFRRLLIEQPVLTAFDLQKQKVTLPLLADQLNHAYQPAPLAHLVDGVYHCCSRCNNLLLQTVKGKLICENERCQAKGRQPQAERTIAPEKEVLWLKRELRRFISAPGIAELQLAEKLEKKGLTVELWPAFDRYDLRVVFPNDEAWAIDVKDWANSFLLGRSVEPIPPDPPWSKAFFVFPNERGQQRSDYVRAFTSYCRHTQGMLERTFMKRVSAKLKEMS